MVGGAVFGASLGPRWPVRREPGRRLARVGLQLYTVRDQLKADMDRTLAAVAAIGYGDVEFAGYFGRTPRAVRDSLRLAGLRAPSAHVALPDDDAAWARTLADANAAGHEWVVIPWVAEPLRRSTSDWHRLAGRLDTLGDQARRAGLRLAYHNQAYDVATLDGSTPLELLLNRTSASLVAFEMDVYWVTKGGGDPLSFIQRHARRFAMIHAKDATAPPERRMVDVGQGTIDFVPILAALPALRHVFAEHDDAADPMISAAASYVALRALRF